MKIEELKEQVLKEIEELKEEGELYKALDIAEEFIRNL